jgi:hypothetical protein
MWCTCAACKSLKRFSGTTYFHPIPRTHFSFESVLCRWNGDISPRKWHTGNCFLLFLEEHVFMHRAPYLKMHTWIHALDKLLCFSERVHRGGQTASTQGCVYVWVCVLCPFRVSCLCVFVACMYVCVFCACVCAQSIIIVCISNILFLRQPHSGARCPMRPPGLDESISVLSWCPSLIFCPFCRALRRSQKSASKKYHASLCRLPRKYSSWPIFPQNLSRLLLLALLTLHQRC